MKYSKPTTWGRERQVMAMRRMSNDGKKNELNVDSSTAEQLREQDAGGMEFSRWLRKVGLSRSTGYRYRRDRKLVTCNIDGIEFILTEEIVRFWQRAKTGEFAKKPRGASAKLRRSLEGIDRK